MESFVDKTGEGVVKSAVPAEEATITETRKYLSETHSGTVAESPPGGLGTTTRVRYGETEAIPVRRRLAPITDTQPFDVGTRDQEIEALVSECNDLSNRMREAEDIIERENIYRAFNERLISLFQLRSNRERTFGHLLVLVLGITQNTTSEFFSEKQFTALDRAVSLAKKHKIVEPDLKDAERLLVAAGLDVFRPLRGVFESEDE